jgi:hypothetical protein
MGASRAARSKAQVAKCTGIEQRSMNKTARKQHATHSNRRHEARATAHKGRNFQINMALLKSLFLFSFKRRAKRL